MRTQLLRAAAAALLACAAGCRSTNSILSEYERDITTGQYAAAEACVAERAQDSGDNQLLWQLHAESAAALQNKLDASIAWADKAEQKCQDNDTTSVFAQGMSHGVAFLANDMYYAYDASGPERVFNGLAKAKGYAALGQVQAARVELNRMQDWQDNYLFNRKKQVAAAEQDFQKNSTPDARAQGITGQILSNSQFRQQVGATAGEDVTQPVNLDTLAKADYVNAYALHLAGLFRWINGDGGRTQLKRAAELAGNNPFVRQDAAEVDKGAKPPAGTVWVYFEDGLCPRRSETRIQFPLPLSYRLSSLIYVAMAFPRLYDRPAAAAAYSVGADGQTYPAAPLQDVDRLVRTDYRIWFRGALTREIARAAVKVGSQIALEVVKQTGRREDAIYYDLGKLLAIGWTASTVGADIRSWTALPKAVYSCRVPKPASGKISVNAGGEILEIQLPSCNTAIVWIRKTSATAPSVASVASFQ